MGWLVASVLALVLAPAVPGSKGAPPPARGPDCAALVEAVARGGEGVTALVRHCRQHLSRAVERAPGPVDVSGLARSPRRSDHTFSSPSNAGRVTWEGTCVAHVDEAIAAVDHFPPPACLVDGRVRQEEGQERAGSSAEDHRAQFLQDHPRLAAEFDRCVRKTQAETCLERLLPMTGSGRRGDADVEKWLPQRDRILAPAPAGTAEMHCQAVLADRESLVLRCQGELASDICREAAGPIESVVGRLCTASRTLVVPVALGVPPAARCVDLARAASRAPRSRLVAARRAALEACSTELDPTSGRAQDREEQHPLALEDEELTLPARALITAVLARQREVFGELRLSPACRRAGGACREYQDQDLLGRRVATGCGFDVHDVTRIATSGYSNGDWDRSLGHALTRSRRGDPPATPWVGGYDPYAPLFAIGNTLRAGNYFAVPEGPVNRRHDARDFADLVADVCQRRGGDAQACTTYADGRGPDVFGPPGSSAEWRRVRALVRRDWPTSSKRLEARLGAIERGLALDVRQGEQQRQQCQPLLVDPCTGDIAEVCLVTPSPELEACRGTRLPDGRCQVYRFARLAVRSPAAPRR